MVISIGTLSVSAISIIRTALATEKNLDVRIAEKVRITKIKMAAVHKHPNDVNGGLDR